MTRLARRWRARRPRTPATLRAALALVLATGGLLILADEATGGNAATTTREASAGGAGAPTGASLATQGGPPTSSPNAPDKSPEPPGPGEPSAYTPTSPALVDQGRTLFHETCSSCHGFNLEGRTDVAPSLVGVGAGPAEFYLSTGRMPLSNPRVEPLRAPPHFSNAQVEALVAFVASYGGPPAPIAEPSKGELAEGLHVFTLNCAGCHQIVARGGLTLGAAVPDLQSATSQQIAEAVRMGPYLMPHFSARQIDQAELDSLARYVLWTRHPSNKGGWGIYNLGPIPEGMVAWFLLLAALVLTARLIGETTA
ncbi:MAG: c-type cytochrome [Solirubrobacterales bacterium]|nr:c-type cytochrome [Solirubrobacterales bacterium]